MTFVNQVFSGQKIYWNIPASDYQTPENDMKNVMEEKPVNMIKKSLKCYFCEEIFQKKRSLKRHIRKVHEGMNPLKFRDKLKIILDKRIKEVENEVVTKPDQLVVEAFDKTEPLFDIIVDVVDGDVNDFQVDYNFNESINTSREIETPENDIETPLSYSHHECKHCSETFEGEEQFELHILSVHQGKKRHECKHCNETFEGEEEFKIHIKSAHEKKKPNDCEICHETFDGEELFKIHNQSVHEGKKPHECKQCHEIFEGEEQFKIHIQSVQEGKKRYDCKHCHESFDKKKDF